MKVFYLLVALNASIVVAVENWPQFRGPDGQGHADDANLPVTWSTNQNVTWRTEIPGKGWSSPVIWGQQIWMTTATEKGRSLRAVGVDGNTGKILHDVEVFHRAEALSIDSKNSHASPTPVIEDGRVYVNFGTTGTACLDTGSGKVLWRSTELQLDHVVGPGSSPIMYRELIVLTCDGADTQFVAALHKATGQLAWKTPRSGKLSNDPGVRKSFNTPLVVTVNGRDQIIMPGADWVYGYEPLTGKELWRTGFHGYSSVMRPVTGHGLFWIGTGCRYPEVLAIRLSDHAIAWKLTRNVPSTPSPVLVGDELYLVSDQGAATCVDPKSGRSIWEVRFGGNFSASPIVASGRIYFGSEQGKVRVVAAGREFKLLATNDLGERILASPAVSGNTLFLRTAAALYRIEQADPTKP